MVSLNAAPIWTAPKELPFGTLGTVELREADPSRPAPPRPGDDRLGPLELRGAEPLSDGRGWRLTVQALQPGTQVVAPMDLGDGQVTPELRIAVPRTTPFGAPWVGVGGGQEDILPLAPFPWGWASLLLLPVFALLWAGIHFWQRGSSKRTMKRAQSAFRRHWPPPNWERPALDQAHLLGRELLAARFGEEARSWGTAECHRRHLTPWVHWVQAMDEGRFGGHPSQFPSLEALLRCLEAR
ncbi:hypothetical protein [Holophaga foetida]|uniref:hypothetical protein n=1 Tax=Holophaga foetida TaxID=35839 RepID=UPI00031C89B0|nr:hypothetical protein [Holophaga foetida]